MSEPSSAGVEAVAGLPDDLPLRTAIPGEPLPPVPDSAHPPDAKPIPAAGYGFSCWEGGGILRLTIRTPSGRTYAGDLLVQP